MFPKGSDGREICIKFHSKGDCFRDCSRSNAPIRGQAQEDYIYNVNHFQTGYEVGNFTWKRKISGGGRNFYQDGWQGHQKHRCGGGGDRHWVNGDQHNRGTGRDDGHQGGNRGGSVGNVNTPNLTPHKTDISVENTPTATEVGWFEG